MRRPHGTGSDSLTNPIIAGAVILLVGVVMVALSYNANRGLPFVPTYRMSVDVQDAAKLIEGSSDVRVGGSRVGLVTKIEAMPGQGGHQPFARLDLSLDPDLYPLPVDSVVQVRSRSLLGAKYIELIPGHSRRGVPSDGVLPLHQARRAVEIEQALRIFDHKTGEAIRTAVHGIGDALAGRGGSLNDTIGATRELLPPSQRLLRTVVAPSTELDRFIEGLDTTLTALAPVAPQLGSLFDHAATTLAGFDRAGSSLGRGIHELPPTESVGTRVLTRITPVLADAAALARALKPGTSSLSGATKALADAVEVGTPVLRRAPPLPSHLGRTFSRLGSLSRDPASGGAIRELDRTVVPLRGFLELAVPAQVQCNVAALWARNVGQFVSEGNADGTWYHALVMLNPAYMSNHVAPAPNLHYNPYPNENYQECEAGNEPFGAGQVIGNPAGLQQNSTEMTSPPPGVRELAAGAGLLGSGFDGSSG